MARAKGIPEDLGFSGRIGDLVFYTLDGQTVVRQIGAPGKKTYYKSPRYESCRQHWGEFGLASSLSKTLRKSLRPYIGEWKLARTNASLTGILRKIILLGSGKPGERSFEVKHLAMLDGIGLNTQKALWSNGKPFRFDHQKGEVYLRMTYGKPKKLFGENDLPLKIVLGVVALSKVHFKDEYQILHPQWHGQSAFNSKKTINRWPPSGELRLNVKLKTKEPLPDGVGLMGILGVSYR